MIPEWKARQRENEAAYKNRGRCLHLSCVIRKDENTGKSYKVSVDGQYRNPDSRASRNGMTKAEKKANRKALTKERILAQLRAGNIRLRPITKRGQK